MTKASTAHSVSASVNSDQGRGGISGAQVLWQSGLSGRQPWLLQPPPLSPGPPPNGSCLHVMVQSRPGGCFASLPRGDSELQAPSVCDNVILTPGLWCCRGGGPAWKATARCHFFFFNKRRLPLASVSKGSEQNPVTLWCPQGRHSWHRCRRIR